MSLSLPNPLKYTLGLWGKHARTAWQICSGGKTYLRADKSEKPCDKMAKVVLLGNHLWLDSKAVIWGIYETSFIMGLDSQGMLHHLLRSVFTEYRNSFLNSFHLLCQEVGLVWSDLLFLRNCQKELPRPQPEITSEDLHSYLRLTPMSVYRGVP